MYFDTRPCAVCGAEVELRPRETADETTEPDGTVDERVCTNRDCPSHGDPDQRP